MNIEGYVVCKECGVVLDDSARLRHNFPYSKNNLLKNNKIQNETLNHNSIGRTSELRYFPNFYRLNKLNNKMYGFETFKLNLSREVFRLLSSLDLPISLSDEVIRNSLIYYKQLEKRSRFRNAYYIAPVSLYIICLERIIFINKIKFDSIINIDKKLFNRCYSVILSNNKNLNKFRSDDFRKKLVLKQLLGLMEAFELNINFIDRARKNLNLYWNLMKNTKNSIVAGLVYLISRKNINNKMVSEFLGISPSTLKNTHNKLIKQLKVSS